MEQPWIYIVLAGLVLIVYARISPKKQEAAGREKKMLSEMEQTIEHFAAELEEQNQALIEMFAETKKEYELHHAKLALRLEQLEKQNDLLQQRVGELSSREPGSRSASVPQPEAGVSSGPSGHEEAARGQASALYLAAEPEPAPASLMNVKERYSELFQLYSQGKSTDVIAKKLGMNKGEINLIVQLAEREEQSNAKQ